MDTETKLNYHLEHIVMPQGVPMDAKQVLDLCDRATKGQRAQAFHRATIHNPLLLMDEFERGQRWISGGQ